MTKQKLDLAALIAADVAPALAEPGAPVGDTAPAGVARSSALARVERRPTLKERACQQSLYLEPAVYERLREIAFHERTKIHALLLEAVDLLLAKRGAPSIAELIGGKEQSGPMR